MGNELSAEDVGSALRDSVQDAVVDRVKDGAGSESESSERDSERGDRRTDKKKPVKRKKGKRQPRRRKDEALSSDSDSPVDEAASAERLRTQRRQRRENFRRERNVDDARYEARKKAEPACGGCCASPPESDATPTDPGSDFSDRNFYISRRSGHLRRKYRRPEEPFDTDSLPDDDANDEVLAARPRSIAADSRSVICKALVAIEARERGVIADGEADTRCALEFGLAAPGPVQAAPVAGGGPSNELQAACSLLFVNPALDANNQLALVMATQRLLAMPESSQPVELDLGGVQLGDDGAFLAARALRARPTLDALILASSGFTDYGAEILAATIEQVAPRRIAVLDLSSNQLSYRGVMALVKALGGIFPRSRPSKHDVVVSFEENDLVWHTSPGNRQALAERVAHLAQSRVMVELPPAPAADT